MEGRQSRKVSLTATMIKQQLSFPRIPAVNSAGKIVKFVPNSEQKRLVIFDAHRDAPVGFGAAVNRTYISYVLHRAGAKIGDP